MTVNGDSNVIILDDQVSTIKDILTSSDVGFKPGVITRVRLQREDKEYIKTLREIYDENAPEIDVRAGDHIFVEDTSAVIETSTSIVDNRGNLVFKEVVQVKAAGLTLKQLSTKIKIQLNLPDSQNAFQIKFQNLPRNLR